MTDKEPLKNGEETAHADSPASGVASSFADAASDEFRELSAEIVDLFYTQTCSPGKIDTEAAVCEAFTNILLRHWDLCCVVTFLQDDGGHLSESFIYTKPELDKAKTRRVSKMLASMVERTGREALLMLEGGTERSGESRRANKALESASDEQIEDQVEEIKEAMKDARLEAGVAVPIHVRGALVGALVALSIDAKQLQDALSGVRFVSAPIVIAIGNARRTADMSEQHREIERLVEELKRRTSALEDANLELQRVARYRSLFLARMSHELRTPLTSVLGFAEILLDQETLTDTQRRFCEKIQASGLQLQSSLNQLLDLSRLEAGQTELFLHEFSLREMLRESCAAVGRLAEKQEVKIECITSPQLSVIVSDEGKLRQALYNFLAHAIGRSPRGRKVIVRAEPTSATRFLIEISDEGSPVRDSRLFFEPVNLDVNEHGTNMNELGLVIAHRLVSVLGGTVALDTDAAHGLSIRLDLPSCPTDSSEA